MSDTSVRVFGSVLDSNSIDESGDRPRLLPENIEQCAEILTAATKDSIPVSVEGAGSYPVPETDAVALSTEKMTSVREVNGEDFLMVAEAGVSLAQAAEKADSEGFDTVFDTRFASDATVGGAFMSGPYGLSAYRRRTLTDSVMGLKCVAADGSIISGGGRTLKNVTGYELPRMLAGSCGIFALVAEVTVRIRPKAEARKILCRQFPSLKVALAVFDMLRSKPLIPDFLELSCVSTGSSAVITAGFEGFEGGLGEKADDFSAIARDRGGKEADDTAELQTFPVKNENLVTVKVPCAAISVFIEYLDSISQGISLLAHPMESSVHLILPDEAILPEIERYALAVGGKRPLVPGSMRCTGVKKMMSEAEMKIALELKRELDPKNILNPHLLPEL